MSRYLLDVNVLIALHTPAHGSHQKVQRWFQSVGRASFSTCAITQSGFLRVSAQISAETGVGYNEAKIALEKLAGLPGHAFWPLGQGYLDATAQLESRIQGHRQITDAYLLGTALAMRGVLATLDRGVAHLAGAEFRDSVECLS